MNFKYFFLILFGLLFHTYGNTQNTLEIKKKDSISIWKLLKYDVKYTSKSVAHAFTRPLHWKKNSFKTLGVLLGGTIALSTADNSTRRFVQDNKDGVPNIIRDFGWYFGSPQNYFMANAGLYGFGLFTKNEKIRRTSVLIISSSIVSGLFQTFTKNAVGRARPKSGEYLDFNPFANDAGYRAFPSGHTILAITMAHSVAKQFKNTWSKIAIYTIGAIPPFTRLVEDAHWITDIAFSTAVSIFIVDAIDKFLFQKEAYDSFQKKKKVSWNVSFSSNQIGLVGTF